MLKYSRQREAIKTFLAGRYDHPTAETVYLGIKEDFPNISLGTVYRNLSLLSDIGEIQKLSTGIGPDRFDGNPALHYHFICKHCGSVLDLSVDGLRMLLSIARARSAGSCFSAPGAPANFCQVSSERNTSTWSPFVSFSFPCAFFPFNLMFFFRSIL